MVERHRITPLLKRSDILVGLPSLMQQRLEKRVEMPLAAPPNQGFIAVEWRRFCGPLRARKNAFETL
jgi:hypothetical protein